MFARFTRLFPLAWLLIGLAGCASYAVREDTDRAICDLAERPIDLQLPPPADLPAPKPVSRSSAESSAAPAVAEREPEQVASIQPAVQPKEEKKEQVKPRR